MTGSGVGKSVLIFLLVTWAYGGIFAKRQGLLFNAQTSARLQQGPKEKLNANVDRLMTLTERVSRLKLSTNSAPEQTEKVIGSVENIIRRLDFIRQDIGAKKLMLSEEAVDQLDGFAELLVSILTSLDDTDPRLSAVQQKRIEAIEADLDFRMSRIDEIRGASTGPVSYPGVRVVVRTLRNGLPEPNLRIYYLGDAYFESEFAKQNLKSFDGLSSPSEREIPEGYYRLWAGRGDDPTAVSDVKSLLAIRPSDSTKIAVDLLIIK